MKLKGGEGEFVECREKQKKKKKSELVGEMPLPIDSHLF